VCGHNLVESTTALESRLTMQFELLRENSQLLYPGTTKDSTPLGGTQKAATWGHRKTDHSGRGSDISLMEAINLFRWEMP
jgi:hypothetical protein